MKFIIALIFLFVIQPAVAKSSLPENCMHLKETVKADFILLNKKEFIQLGECSAVALLKLGELKKLNEACAEVIEDKNNVLGILSLSKSEALKIGQCVGVINYIYERFHNEVVNGRYGEKYSCSKGIKAATYLSAQSSSMKRRDQLRDLLCMAN